MVEECHRLGTTARGTGIGVAHRGNHDFTATQQDQRAAKSTGGVARRVANSDSTGVAAEQTASEWPGGY